MLRLAAVVGVSAIARPLFGVPLYTLVPIAFVVYLVSGGWKWLRLLAKTFRRDISVVAMMFHTMPKMAKLMLTKTTLRDILYERVRRHPNKLAFVMADTNKSLTFKETEELCHRVANVFYEAGYRKGDVVALLMENRVEYMLIWLGLSMIGVVTSLINHNLRGDSLKHCIDVCHCKAIIFSEDMNDILKEIEDDLSVQPYCFDKGEVTIKSSLDLNVLLESASSLPPPINKDIKAGDTLVYLYTSGTTGLPKAVIWKSYKNIFFLPVLPHLGLKKDDILYNTLPLYHGNAMAIASSIFLSGCTVIIKKKFSASKFMEDCCKYNATVFNYIGETCRYILSQPKSVYDQLNRIRWVIGNGLRASIWTEFQERFQIDQIMEFYGSSEGNTVLFINNCGRVGAVGYRPLLFPNKDLKLIKTDEDSGEIIRGENGLAIEVQNGEVGHVVGVISKWRRFEGYTNPNDTEKKIVHDIVSKGDSAYLTGDLMTKDEEGYYYFQDRTGDTFRWKGENVSTNEVEGLISKVVQLSDVCVYGVNVPGIEGKAGMACICDPNRSVNITELPKSLDQILPKYAQPMFLRLTSAVDVTSTFKFEKNRFRNDGFVIDLCGNGDSLFYFNVLQKKYLPIDHEVYQLIMNKAIRF